MIGKPPKLTPDQAERVRVRYQLYLVNHPQRICNDLGISRSTFQRYAGRLHKTKI